MSNYTNEAGIKLWKVYLRTRLCPGGRRTDWCRLGSEEKRPVLSAPEVSASRSEETVSSSGAEHTAPRSTGPVITGENTKRLIVARETERFDDIVAFFCFLSP